MLRYGTCTRKPLVATIGSCPSTVNRTSPSWTIHQSGCRAGTGAVSSCRAPSARSRPAAGCRAPPPPANSPGSCAQRVGREASCAVYWVLPTRSVSSAPAPTPATHVDLGRGSRRQRPLLVFTTANVLNWRISKPFMRIFSDGARQSSRRAGRRPSSMAPLIADCDSPV